MVPSACPVSSTKTWLMLMFIALNVLTFLGLRSSGIATTFCKIGYRDEHVTKFGVLTSEMLVRKYEEAVMLLDKKAMLMESKDAGIESLKKKGESADENMFKSEGILQFKSEETLQFISKRKLPLGWSGALQSDSVISPIGHACALEKEALDRFMNYTVGEICPDDSGLAQKLLVHGCEPLPRRRCFARAPKKFSDKFPVPFSSWNLPPDDHILWTQYPCKSFECMNARKRAKVSADCIDCFDLQGPELRRWVSSQGLSFSIQEVLALKNGSIRIGLDIGGGTGTFAVRMQEHGVFVVASTLNLDGPFNNVVAFRGVVPLFLTISQRFPFFDNTLDLVHSMHVLSGWIPYEMFEFILYDIYRILRPGGIFWLDRFFCLKPQFDAFGPLIEKMGFVKLKWVLGDKLDRGPQFQEMYLSAILEKPRMRT